jgi:hypothetical protein
MYTRQPRFSKDCTATGKEGRKENEWASKLLVLVLVTEEVVVVVVVV